MTTWFVFNGDADGLCAAHQLRLAGHAPDQVITGVKRDIGLLGRCAAQPGDHVWVADISLDANRAALAQLLDGGVALTWFDHHYAGVIPSHAALSAHIDTSGLVCSSLLVDQHLGGPYRAWAVSAAFGDNLAAPARDLATRTDLTSAAVEQLAELGALLNYNAYGESVADLHVDPALLFGRMAPYENPLDFIADEPFVVDLRVSMQRDLALASAATFLHAGADCAALELPDAPWARRVHGVFANELARAHPGRAHAILVESSAGYAVSVRSPMLRSDGADALCRQFATGGGRAGAAGINCLPRHHLEAFLLAFERAYRQEVAS